MSGKGTGQFEDQISLPKINWGPQPYEGIKEKIFRMRGISSTNNNLLEKHMIRGRNFVKQKKGWPVKIGQGGDILGVV